MTIKVTHFSRKPNPSAFSIERVFEDVRAALPREIVVEERVNEHLSKGVVARLKDAWAARVHSSAVNHITGDVHYITTFLPKKNNILTIHDTIMIERERGIKRFVLWIFWLWLPASRVSWITTISNESKERLLRFVSFAPERLVVIPNPVSPDFAPSPLPERAGPFRLLHIGTKPNKNLERLIPALAAQDVELTVIGSMTEAQKVLLSQYSVKHRALEGLDAEALRDEYARAEAVVFVSLDEGFGLPIIEAQASARPVISSDRAPMTEVAGSGALLVDPKNREQIGAAVAKLASDSSLRHELVAKGLENVERFSPHTIAKAYADLYRKVHGANSRNKQ